MTGLIRDFLTNRLCRLGTNPPRLLNDAAGKGCVCSDDPPGCDPGNANDCCCWNANGTTCHFTGPMSVGWSVDNESMAATQSKRVPNDPGCESAVPTCLLNCAISSDQVDTPSLSHANIGHAKTSGSGSIQQSGCRQWHATGVPYNGDAAGELTSVCTEESGQIAQTFCFTTSKNCPIPVASIVDIQINLFCTPNIRTLQLTVNTAHPNSRFRTCGDRLTFCGVTRIQTSHLFTLPNLGCGFVPQSISVDGSSCGVGFSPFGFCSNASADDCVTNACSQAFHGQCAGEHPCDCGSDLCTVGYATVISQSLSIG